MKAMEHCFCSLGVIQLMVTFVRSGCAYMSQPILIVYPGHPVAKSFSVILSGQMKMGGPETHGNVISVPYICDRNVTEILQALLVDILTY